MALSTDITNKVLQLKEYIVTNGYKSIVKEKYGQESCGCLMNKIKLGVAYVDILECYDLENENANCLTEDQIKLIMQYSTKLINSDC